jgi:hypothetical protein
MENNDIVKNMIKVSKMENRKNGIVMAYYQEKWNSIKGDKREVRSVGRKMEIYDLNIHI